MSNERFAGGNNFTGFKKMANDVLMKNELNNGLGAYEIKNAKNGNSGWSFGPPQWDLSAGKPEYKDTFKNILTEAKDASGNALLTLQQVDTLYSAATSNGALSDVQKQQINQALSSDFGQETITSAYSDYIDQKIAQIDNLLAELPDGADKNFLSTDFAKLVLLDYDNQYTIAPDGEMESYLKGNPAIFGGGTIQKSEDFGLDDLLQPLLSTKNFSNYPYDPIRRFNNIWDVAAANNVAPGIDGTNAQGIVSLFEQKIVSKGYTFNSSTKMEYLHDFESNVVIPAYGVVYPEASSNGPTDNTFTQNITDPSVIGSTSTPDLTTAPNQNGTAASGGTWSISTDANVLNYNTDLFSAIVGDTLTGGIRPGNGIVSPTSAQLTTINGNAALVVERTPENSDPLSQYYMSLDGYQINLSNSSTYVKFLPADPLILDLNGDGVRLTSYQDNVVLFDIDHDGGSKEQTGWVAADTTSAAGGVNTDGIVAYDLNNNGKIDDISETLSEYFNGTAGTSGTAGTKPYANGFAALKSLDSNADNAFTSLDAAWNNVKVWIDADHDGKSFNDANGNGVLDAGEATELKTLDELGITKINLTGTSQSGLVRDGNEILTTGTFVQNGQTKEALAANFIADPDGNTATADGAGLRVTTESGVGTYVSGSAGGEAIDVAAKGVKNAYGGAGNDTLAGDANNNWLVGGLGADTFNAGDGDDVLIIDAEDQQQNIHEITNDALSGEDAECTGCYAGYRMARWMNERVCQSADWRMAA